jgi:hypothetical protein
MRAPGVQRYDFSVLTPPRRVSAIWRLRDRCESSMNFQPAGKVCYSQRLLRKDAKIHR